MGANLRPKKARVFPRSALFLSRKHTPLRVLPLIQPLKAEGAAYRKSPTMLNARGVATARGGTCGKVGERRAMQGRTQSRRIGLGPHFGVHKDTVYKLNRGETVGRWVELIKLSRVRHESGLSDSPRRRGLMSPSQPARGRWKRRRAPHMALKPLQCVECASGVKAPSIWTHDRDRQARPFDLRLAVKPASHWNQARHRSVPMS
jgi:hypothetical protein